MVQMKGGIFILNLIPGNHTTTIVKAIVDGFIIFVHENDENNEVTIYQTSNEDPKLIILYGHCKNLPIPISLKQDEPIMKEIFKGDNIAMLGDNTVIDNIWDHLAIRLISGTTLPGF